MKKNKISLIIILLLSLFLITACDEETEKKVSNDNKVNVKEMKHKVCTRQANAGTNTEVKLKYDLYYTGDIINLLVSKEQIITEDKKTLDEYEIAYKQIKTNYEELEYYDQIVTRTDTSVLNETTINYDKIDIEKLLDIEGEEDNIIENGKAKVDLYIALLKKFGGTCEDVE